MMSEALKHENNEIKRKFAFFFINTINICENTDVFIALENIYGIHSKRANILLINNMVQLVVALIVWQFHVSTALGKKTFPIFIE